MILLPLPQNDKNFRETQNTIFISNIFVITSIFSQKLSIFYVIQTLSQNGPFVLHVDKKLLLCLKNL